MSQPYIGRSREEQYAAPSYGYGQGVGLVPKVTSVVENTQAQKKPFLINYYPSGNTNNPQRVIAQVETVTREVVKNPVTMIEPIMREARSHHGDNQLKRDDEFMNKIREETIKASTGIIDQPKVLSTNNLVDQVIRDEVVSRNIQPSTMIDGWTESSNLSDPSHPRKMAELVSRVSNWRGVNGGSDRTSRPIVDGYNPAGGYGYNNKTTYVTPTYDPNYRISSNNMINGSYVRSDEMGYNRRNEMMSNPQTPRGTAYGYNEPRILGYDGSNSSVMSNQLGYGYGMNNNNGKVERTTAEYDPVYGNGYNLGLTRSSYAGRPGTTSSTVISSVEAVNKYKGTFVPRMQ